MPFYGPFALGEVARPAAERRFREQVPNIGGFSMDMPRNTLGFTSETPGLFGAGPMPSTFGAAIGALPQPTNPLGLSARAGLFEGTSARPESVSGWIDAGGETEGPPGAPPGVPGPGPTAPSAAPTSAGNVMGNVMGFLGEVSAQSPAARVGSRVGIPSALSNLALSFAPPPISLVNMVMGLASALSPKESVTPQSQVVTDLSKAIDALSGIVGPPSPAISAEETSFQEAAQAQGQPAAPPAEDPSTTGFGLGPPGVAEGAASAASASGLSGAEASTAAEAEQGEAGGAAGDAGEGTVVCTELYRQGRLSWSMYHADAVFGAWLAQDAPEVLAGYHRWAPAVVRAMRRSSVVSRAVAWVARPWAREMAHCVDPQRTRGSLTGAVLMSLGWPLCAWLGRRSVVAREP